MSTPPPPPQTRLPGGGQPPPDHLIAVPGIIVDEAKAKYRAGYKEGWAASSGRYIEGDDPFADILTERIRRPKYGGGNESEVACRICEDALAQVVAFALRRIRQEPDSNRRAELERSLVLKLRNLANNIAPPE